MRDPYSLLCHTHYQYTPRELFGKPILTYVSTHMPSHTASSICPFFFGFVQYTHRVVTLQLLSTAIPFSQTMPFVQPRRLVSFSSGRTAHSTGVRACCSVDDRAYCVLLEVAASYLLICLYCSKSPCKATRKGPKGNDYWVACVCTCVCTCVRTVRWVLTQAH